MTLAEIEPVCNDINLFESYVDRHPTRLLARQMQEPFMFRGHEYPAGDYLVVIGMSISPTETKLNIERVDKDWFERRYERQE